MRTRTRTGCWTGGTKVATSKCTGGEERRVTVEAVAVCRTPVTATKKKKKTLTPPLIGIVWVERRPGGVPTAFRFVIIFALHHDYLPVICSSFSGETQGRFRIIAGRGGG